MVKSYANIKKQQNNVKIYISDVAKFDVEHKSIMKWCLSILFDRIEFHELFDHRWVMMTHFRNLIQIEKWTFIVCINTDNILTEYV